MKKFLLVCLLLAFFVSCQNKKQEIIAQNNQVVSDQLGFYRLNDSLFTLFEQETTEDVYYEIYDSLTVFLKSAISKYDTLPPADNEGELIVAMQAFLHGYQQLAYNEYRELLHIISKPRYLFVSSDLLAVDSLYSVIDIRQKEIDSVFAAEHSAYSKKHDLLFAD